MDHFSTLKLLGVISLMFFMRLAEASPTIRTIMVNRFEPTSENYNQHAFIMLDTLRNEGFVPDYVFTQNDKNNVITNIKDIQKTTFANKILVFINSSSYDDRQLTKERFTSNIKSLTILHMGENNIIRHSGSFSTYTVDSDKCDDEFTGKIENNGIMVGNVIGSYHGMTDTDGYTDYSYDRTKLLNGNIYLQSRQFVNFKSDDITLNYGCGRSFKSDVKSINNFKNSLKSKIKINLVMDECVTTDKLNYVSSFFNTKGTKLYLEMRDIDCKKFEELLNRAKKLDPDFDLSKKSFGWINILGSMADQTDYIILESILQSTYGYTLTDDFSNFQISTVLWINNEGVRPYCAGTCFYMTFAKQQLGEHLNTKTIDRIYHQYIALRSEDRKNYNFRTCTNLLGVNNIFSVKDSHEDELKKCQVENGIGGEMQNNAALTLAHSGDGQVAIESALGDIRAYKYKDGLVTVAHGAKIRSADSIITEYGEWNKTIVNQHSDFVVFGKKPVVHNATRNMFMTVKGVNYKLKLAFVGNERIYAIMLAKAAYGASGTPIYNEYGQFVSVFASSQTTLANRVDINNVKFGEDLESNIPTLITMPNMSPSNYMSDKTTYVTFKTEDKTREVDFDHPFPSEFGYFQLCAGLGKGKSTRLPLSLVAQRKRVLVIEPFVALAKAVAERLDFTCVAGSECETRMGNNKVMTAGSVCKMLQRSASELATYDIILLDEAHVEHVDVITLKKWFKEHASSCNLKVVGMSATFPNKSEKGSNYPIEDITVSGLSGLGRYLSNEVNALCFTNSIKNKAMRDLAYSRGMKVIEYNSDAIKKNPSLPFEVAKLLNSTKGVCVVATKVAEVGFNGNIDLVFSYDKDTDRVFSNKKGDLYNEVTVVPLTLASYIQRRGRVGRNKPGKFIFCGQLPSIVENHSLLSHFSAELRLNGIGDYMVNSVNMNYVRSRVNFEDQSAERKCCDVASWENDPLDFIRHADPVTGKYNESCDHFKTVTQDRYANGPYMTDHEMDAHVNDWDSYDQLIKDSRAASELEEAIGNGKIADECYRKHLIEQAGGINQEHESDPTLEYIKCMLVKIISVSYPILMLVPSEYSKIENKVKNLNDQFNFWNAIQKNISMCKSLDFIQIKAEGRDFLVSVFPSLNRIDYQEVREKLDKIYQHCKVNKFSKIILIDQIVPNSLLKATVLHKLISLIFYDIEVLLPQDDDEMTIVFKPNYTWYQQFINNFHHIFPSYIYDYGLKIYNEKPIKESTANRFHLEDSEIPIRQDLRVINSNVFDQANRIVIFLELSDGTSITTETTVKGIQVGKVYRTDLYEN